MALTRYAHGRNPDTTQAITRAQMLASSSLLLVYLSTNTNQVTQLYDVLRIAVAVGKDLGSYRGISPLLPRRRYSNPSMGAASMRAPSALPLCESFVVSS